MRASTAGSDAGGLKTTSPAPARGCASRRIKTGVRLQTVVGTQRGIDELVIADGVARPIADAECKGTERAEWSQDGRACSAPPT